LTVFPD